MGQILYHKLSAEITGPDGREWNVSVEPPLRAPPAGEETKFDVEIQRVIRREEQSVPGIDDGNEPLRYIVPSRDGMFAALSTALNLVPDYRGND